MKLILILLLLSTELFAQSGRYRINTADTQQVENGFVTITQPFIRIEIDSTVTTLPVIDSGKHRSSTYYILEGCVDGTYIRGAGMWNFSSTESLGGGHHRYHSTLYVELRARQQYISTKYSLYYDK